MNYIFDTCSFQELFRYPESRFPTLWKKFELIFNEGRINSVREVHHEILRGQKSRLQDWSNKNKGVFLPATAAEAAVVTQIFQNKQFQNLIKQSTLLKGGHEADPFVIARAEVSGSTVVTQEKFKLQAAKIPNVCDALKVPCINLEEFMEKENWQF